MSATRVNILLLPISMREKLMGAAGMRRALGLARDVPKLQGSRDGRPRHGLRYLLSGECNGDMRRREHREVLALCIRDRASIIVRICKGDNTVKYARRSQKPFVRTETFRQGRYCLPVLQCYSCAIDVGTVGRKERANACQWSRRWAEHGL